MNALTGMAGGELAEPTTRPYSKWFDPHPRLGISMIDHLYNRLDGAYPHWWSANFSSQQAIDNWAESWVEAFEDEGITPEDVAVGLRTCRVRYQKPPSCAEFIQACKPSADPVPAYHEAVEGIQARRKGELGAWSHPAIYWAAMLLARDLMTQSYGQVKDRWAATLKAQLARNEWADIPPPAPALPAPGQANLSKEDAARMLRELDALGVNKAAKPGEFDHLRWARRIMQRVDAGDKSLHAVQIANAKEVLGLT